MKGRKGNDFSKKLNDLKCPPNGFIEKITIYLLFLHEIKSQQNLISIRS